MAEIFVNFLYTWLLETEILMKKKLLGSSCKDFLMLLKKKNSPVIFVEINDFSKN